MILLYAFEHFLIPGSFRFLEFPALIRTILSNFVNHKKIIPRYFLMRLPSHPSKYRIFFIPLSLFIHFSGLIDSSHNQFWGKTCKNVIDANFIFCVLLQSRIHIEAFFFAGKMTQVSRMLSVYKMYHFKGHFSNWTPVQIQFSILLRKSMKKWSKSMTKSCFYWLEICMQNKSEK